MFRFRWVLATTATYLMVVLTTYKARAAPPLQPPGVWAKRQPRLLLC